MLVLSRQRDETIMIGDHIEVTVVDIRGDKVRLGINAPREVPVHRKEVYEAIKRENRAAAQVQPDQLSDLTGGQGNTGGFAGNATKLRPTQAGGKRGGGGDSSGGGGRENKPASRDNQRDGDAKAETVSPTMNADDPAAMVRPTLRATSQVTPRQGRQRRQRREADGQADRPAGGSDAAESNAGPKAPQADASPDAEATPEARDGNHTPNHDETNGNG